MTVDCGNGGRTRGMATRYRCVIPAADSGAGVPGKLWAGSGRRTRPAGQLGPRPEFILSEVEGPGRLWRRHAVCRLETARVSPQHESRDLVPESKHERQWIPAFAGMTISRHP